MAFPHQLLNRNFAMAQPSKVTPLRAKHPCPLCGKPSARETYPFCSTRCKDIDLNRWFSGGYAIPARQDDDEPDGGGGE